ncbi:MAG: SLC13 family permease [Candidatus Bathyarchaeota archaeon]|jgi:Na+/H+ antiporter NhaD/arsenite permease-like protein|nr:SLC13 family permease [Candidatus Bathyarchaeota archaeon]
MNAVQGLAVLVFVIIFLLIAVEAIHRTHAALLGAFIFVFIGAVRPDELLHFIDIEILAVVLGLFLLVRGAERSGLFQLLAVRIMRSSSSPTAFAVILLSFSVLLSVLVSNIGAMLIMASITITMARSLKIRPQTLLIFQAIVINVGGMTLWTASIPNIIIGIEGNLSFMDFVVNVLPLGLLLFAATLLVFIKMFKKDFTPEPEAEFMEMEFDEWIDRAIDVSGLRGSRMDWSKMSAAVILVGTIVSFITYERFDLTPAFVALAGGFLMMMIQSNEPSSILREIDWSTILFLGGLFVMINGLGKMGIIEMLSHSLSGFLGRTPLRASVSLMWLSGLVSSIVDNIPLSTSLAPIVRDLVIDDSWAVLWWGLIIGANLGGCMTPIGSPSSIITIGVSEQEGYPISFNTFLKMGLGLTVLYFLISMAYLYIRFGLL